MEYRNVLDLSTRQQFREWLSGNAHSERECYVCVRRGRPVSDEVFWYLDAVEEALCFGWIDSTVRIIDGKTMQRFSPRNKNGNWTELNKERVRRLERLGLMTDAGRAVLPSDMDMGSFRIDENIEDALRSEGVLDTFKAFHPLYQRIRASKLAFYRTHRPTTYERMLRHVVEETKKGRMYGEWNDYGRLMDY